MRLPPNRGPQHEQLPQPPRPGDLLSRLLKPVSYAELVAMLDQRETLCPPERLLLHYYTYDVFGQIHRASNNAQGLAHCDNLRRSLLEIIRSRQTQAAARQHIAALDRYIADSQAFRAEFGIEEENQSDNDDRS